jgi:hypothetical protein
VVKLLSLAHKSWVRLPLSLIVFMFCNFLFLFSWFHSCCLLLHLSLQLFFLASKVLYLFLQPFSLIGQIDEIIRLVQIYLHFFIIIVTLLIQCTTTNSNLSQNLGLRKIHDISYQQSVTVSRFVTKSRPELVVVWSICKSMMKFKKSSQMLPKL